MDGWMDGWTDGWMDGFSDVFVFNIGSIFSNPELSARGRDHLFWMGIAMVSIIVVIIVDIVV